MQRRSIVGTIARRRWQAERLAIAVTLIFTLAGIAPLSGGFLTPTDAGAVALGGGSYRVTGTVFGTAGDGLIGGMTSSGRFLRGNDRLAALPSCTESSCPWLELRTGPEAEWGPQTACAEADGLCWIAVVSTQTGTCAVAPVLDVGPLFIKDNWWANEAQRTYPLEQGLPAAEVAVDGVDFGFGPGISDKGYNIAGVYDYAAAVDLGAGTWTDLGLDPGRLVAELEVTLLWQAGITHEAACGGAAPLDLVTPAPVIPQPVATTPVTPTATPVAPEPTIPAPETPLPLTPEAGDPVTPSPVPTAPPVAPEYAASPEVIPPPPAPPPTPEPAVLLPTTGEGNATTLDLVYLRTDPAVDAPTIGLVAGQSRVTITGGGIAGYFPVTIGELTGWIFGDFLAPDGGEAGTVIATATDDINLRTAPAWDAAGIGVVPAGSIVLPTGRPENGFIPAQVDGLSGWVPVAYLAYRDPEQAPLATTVTAVTVETTSLQAGPAGGTETLTTVAPGAVVDLIGDSENGYLRVASGGFDGWVWASSLDGYATAVISSELQLRGTPNLDGAVLATMPTNAIVVLTGEEENGYVSVSYLGIGGWAYAGYLQ
ncbi:MAG: hypothetical protein ACR2LS_08985 [Thermomicrobiales bacterium]